MYQSQNELLCKAHGVNEIIISATLDVMKLFLCCSTLCLKKVPTFKLSVTSSNLNGFSKLLHYRKACEICYKCTQHYPPHLRHVATLPWDVKNSIFLQIFNRYGKMQTKCTFGESIFNSSPHVTVYGEFIYVFLSKSCPRHWMPCWLLRNSAMTSVVMNFRCHRLIAKVNK